LQGVGGRADHREQHRPAKALDEVVVHLAGQTRPAQRVGGGRADLHADAIRADQPRLDHEGPRLADGEAAAMLERSINIPPTVVARQGAAIRVFVARDLDFTAVEEAAAETAKPRPATLAERR